MYYTSKDHEMFFKETVSKYGISDDRARLAALYCLTATSSMRMYIKDLIKTDDIGTPYPNKDAVTAEWPCSSDKILINLSVNLFSGSEEIAITPFTLTEWLGDDLFRAAVQAMYICRDGITE